MGWVTGLPDEQQGEVTHSCSDLQLKGNVKVLTKHKKFRSLDTFFLDTEKMSVFFLAVDYKQSSVSD